MGARAKLNGAFFNGSLLLAGLIGAVTGSWLVCCLALTALIAVNVGTGDIRLNQRKR